MSKSPLILFLILSLAMAPLAAQAQDAPAGSADPANAAPSAPVYSQPQLDQMLAPIALYPDPLIGQILMASTYPLEVVEASRWLQNPANASLTGDQLASALDQQPWDPSVKAITAVPQVLTMMDKNLQWTEQLGDAFLAQQAAVTDSVQHLRQQAQAAGSLNSTPQQVVSTDGSYIEIQPANPDVVYVPAYNPQVVYGTWGYPAYPPYYFYPPGYSWGPAAIGFGVGIVVARSVWGWDHWDWRNRRIDIDDRRFSALNHGRPPLSGGIWHHDPAHRGGVPYRDAATRARFESGNAPAARREFRGYRNAVVTPGRQTSNFAARVGGSPQHEDHAAIPAHQEQHFTPPERPQAQQHAIEPTRNVAPAQHFAAGPSFQRAPAPMTESFAHGANVRAESARGAASRSAPAPAPVQRAQAPSAPHGGGGGGGGHPQANRGNDRGNRR